MRRIIFIFFCIIITIPQTCYAVHSGIFKNIQSYNCDDYHDILSSHEIENELFNYLGNKQFTLIVYKWIKSPKYLQEVKDFIREEYPPPIYNPENVLSAINKEDKIVIRQEVYYNLKNRTAVIEKEYLIGYPSKKTLLNIDCDLFLPRESYLYFIDEDNEYGQLANDAINFMESIKDIYFNPEIRKQYEEKEANHQIISKGNDYLHYWSGDLTSIYMKNDTKVLMDIPSFHETDQRIYEGWLKFIPDESLNLDIKESKIFFKVDYHNSTMYAIFEVKTDKNGQQIYNKCSEKWTMSDAKFVNSVLENLNKKFSLGKTFRQITGFDIGDSSHTFTF